MTQTTRAVDDVLPSDESEQAALGARSKESRGKRTQAAVAAEIGVTQQAESLWEAVACLTETVLLAIASAADQ